MHTDWPTEPSGARSCFPPRPSSTQFHFQGLVSFLLIFLLNTERKAGLLTTRSHLQELEPPAMPFSPVLVRKALRDLGLSQYDAAVSAAVLLLEEMSMKDVVSTLMGAGVPAAALMDVREYLEGSPEERTALAARHSGTAPAEPVCTLLTSLHRRLTPCCIFELIFHLFNVFLVRLPGGFTLAFCFRSRRNASQASVSRSCALNITTVKATLDLRYFDAPS